MWLFDIVSTFWKNWRTQYLPNDQYMMLQNHAWEKYPFERQNRLVDFNISEYQIFVNMVPDSTMQLNFRKRPLSSLDIVSRRISTFIWNIHKHLKGLWNCASLCLVHFIVRLCSFKRITTKAICHKRLNVKTHMKSSCLLWSQTLKRVTNMENSVTLLTKFLFGKGV